MRPCNRRAPKLSDQVMHGGDVSCTARSYLFALVSGPSSLYKAFEKWFCSCVCSGHLTDFKRRCTTWNSRENGSSLAHHTYRYQNKEATIISIKLPLIIFIIIIINHRPHHHSILHLSQNPVCDSEHLTQSCTPARCVVIVSISSTLVPSESHEDLRLALEAVS